MSVLLLVRHGQASWGADDYDVLSELGHEQSRLLGAHLAAQEVTPTHLASGGLRRHHETVDSALAAARWSAAPSTDRRWSEFDHVELLRRYDDASGDDSQRPEAYNEIFDAAVSRWTAGDDDADYSESFTAFGRRVEEGLREAAGALSGGETAVVVTSGGAIAWVVASLWGGGVEQWSRVNPVLVNTGVTKVVTGRRGLSLVSVNEHSHLDRRTLTYR